MNCKTQTTNTKLETFIGLARDLNGSKSFEEMFKQNHHIEKNCCKCNKNTKHVASISYSLYDRTQYIIFRLNLSIISHNQINRMEMKIKNFNPEEIKVPGINESFRLLSTIKYTEMFRSNLEQLGHYTCQVRNGNTWINISDQNGYPFNFEKDLSNIFILLVEKKN